MWPQNNWWMKLLSGRLFLTWVAGICMVMLVYAYTHKEPSISSDAISSIVTAVFVSYFMKNRTNEGVK